MKSEDMKNYALVAFWGIMALSIVVFTVSYAFVDWEAVSEEMESTVQEFTTLIHCEIEYQDFRYKGMCTEPEMILQYAMNMTGGCE